MQKIFTNLVAASLMLGSVGATAQTQIWPTADTNTINASQFKGAASLFTITRTDTVVPAMHKGWYTKGLVSASATKADSAVWQWNTNGSSRGAYGGATTFITSPTVANGAPCPSTTAPGTRLTDACSAEAVPGTRQGTGTPAAPSPHAGSPCSGVH